jgi:hypothetical protein
MRSRQSAWSEDFWRRTLIERAPPLSWWAISLWALATAIAAASLLAGLRGPWEGVAGIVALVGLIQIARGAVRKAWLGLGGTDRPITTAIRRRLGR